MVFWNSNRKNEDRDLLEQLLNRNEESDLLEQL